MAKKTIEELEKELAEAKAEEKELRGKKRKQYEEEREGLVNSLSAEAYKIAVFMISLKSEATKRLNEFKLKMLEYGDLRRGEKNKGSFELKTEQWKVVFAHQIIKKFDERAYTAEKHISEFLKSFLKKKDKATHDMVSALLKRDEESGQFDIDMINRLYTMEDRFDDPNWKKGIQLFKESYAPYSTAQYIRFYQKNEDTGSWDLLNLDFAKIKPSLLKTNEV